MKRPGNMKGGVAAMIEAARLLQRAGVRLRGDLVIASVVGELQGGVVISEMETSAKVIALSALEFCR
jgi:hypothetical protein